MKRRIFIALGLPPELKRKIAEAIKQWRWLPIRWLAPEHWHVTLVPPAYLEDSEVATLIALLRKSRLGRVFSLRFSHITLAPPGVAARMIWLEGETPPELNQLKKKLEEIWASQAELPPLKVETRPLKLHVTLARFPAGNLREIGEKTRVLGEVDFPCGASEVEVIESHLQPGGAEYEILATIAV